MLDDGRTLAELLADRERLITEKEDNSDILASCRAQIDAAQAKAIAGDGYSDPRWMAAVKTRARYAGRLDQQLGRQLAVLRQKIIEARQALPPAKSYDPDTNEIELLIAAIKLIGRALDIIRAKQVTPQ